MTQKYSHQGRRIKGRVQSNKGQRTYTDTRGGLLENRGPRQMAHPTESGEGLHNTRVSKNENPLRWMEYTGDKIGLINISRMIPFKHGKKKKH